MYKILSHFQDLIFTKTEYFTYLYNPNSNLITPPGSSIFFLNFTCAWKLATLDHSRGISIFKVAAKPHLHLTQHRPSHRTHFGHLDRDFGHLASDFGHLASDFCDTRCFSKSFCQHQFLFSTNSAPKFAEESNSESTVSDLITREVSAHYINKSTSTFQIQDYSSEFAFLDRIAFNTNVESKHNLHHLFLNVKISFIISSFKCLTNHSKTIKSILQ